MTNTPLKVLIAASEMAPFAKVGGLADVIGSLPKALKKRGVDVKVVMPRYKQIRDADYVLDFPVDIAGRIETAIVRRIEVEASDSLSFDVYFIDSYRYFFRDYIYAGDDDAERFAFFGKAVLEMLPKLGWKPDVIHLNDWQTGAVPFMLKNRYAQMDFYKDMASVYTVHNLQYQGVFPKDVLGLLGASASNFHPDDLEFYGGINFMKAGLLYADKLNTVSPTYSREIQTSQFGERLDGVLRKRAQDLYGILNGIDYDEFNPERDSRIVQNYSKHDIDKKTLNKQALQREFGLPVENVPVIGLVSRLVDQKGLDLIHEIVDDLTQRDMQLIVLGTGDPRYHDMFQDLGARHPHKVGVKIGFDINLAQRIYAGSDMFLMPSRFEPCGLGQIISLRYGTVPIVRSTGGLSDTIIDTDTKPDSGNGFAFSEYSGRELLATIDRALGAYKDAPRWSNLVERAMASDFSWSKSADEYVSLYRKAHSKRTKGAA